MTDQGFDCVVQTPVGWLGFSLVDGAIERMGLMAEASSGKAGDSRCKIIAGLMADYFQDASSWPEDLPLRPKGTAFQIRVWDELRRIPTGSTLTYGDLAKKLGSSARAVGGACRANPIGLLIPCHRVVAKNGDGGFSGQVNGYWMSVKRWLLAHEHG